jgi:hypothetical protein
MSDMYDSDEFTDYDDRDDGQAQAELGAERRETTLRCLYNGAMLGMPDEDVRHLLRECGLTWADIELYTPPILRLSNQPKENASLTLPF